MAATFIGDISISDITFGEKVEQNQNGSNLLKLNFRGEQFKNIQLGKDVMSTLRCAWGVEKTPLENSNQFRYQMKLDCNPETSSFFEQLDAKVKAEVEKHQKSGGITGTYSLNSVLRPSTNPSYPASIKLKVYADTEVYTCSLKDSKMTSPSLGTIEDIKPNTLVLPIVKINGGVYFINESFGTSIAASKILVVNTPRNIESVPFNFGDVAMEED